MRWNILPDVEVGAYAYNGQVPGPLIRVRPHDRVRMRVRNELPEPTTVHWHGLILPIEQDGVPELSQPPIPPSGEHVYEFDVPDSPGTYFYHTHFSADRQQPLGLYGALIIDDPERPPEVASEQVVMLGEWTVIGSETYPAMQLDGMLPNYFTFNGKSYPATETLPAKVGDRILFRLIGSGQFIHPIHIHGGPFEIAATDGNPVPAAARLTKDTVLVGPGERYDVVWTARNLGQVAATLPHQPSHHQRRRRGRWWRRHDHDHRRRGVTTSSALRRRLPVSLTIREERKRAADPRPGKLGEHDSIRSATPLRIIRRGRRGSSASWRPPC